MNNKKNAKIRAGQSLVRSFSQHLLPATWSRWLRKGPCSSRPGASQHLVVLPFLSWVSPFSLLLRSTFTVGGLAATLLLRRRNSCRARAGLAAPFVNGRSLPGSLLPGLLVPGLSAAPVCYPKKPFAKKDEEKQLTEH